MRRRPVVDRRADHVHPDQLADHDLELEDRLVLAEIGIGVAAVGGQELGAAVDLVADGGDVVLPAAAAEEADHVRRGRCSDRAEEPADVRSEIALGEERRGQVERPVELQCSAGMPSKDRRRRHADLSQHRPPCGRSRVRDVGMRSAVDSVTVSLLPPFVEFARSCHSAPVDHGGRVEPCRR